MRSGTRACVIALVVGAVVAGACGDELRSGSVGDQLYEGTFTVLESPGHGPTLCTGVDASLPPQCGGLPVVGWDWGDVEGEGVESHSGTTWGEWHVTGTYDGERFTLTEAPAPPRQPPREDMAERFAPVCEQPEVVDPAHGWVEWEEREAGVHPIADQVAIWLSNTGPDATGSFVVNVIVLPGAGDAARARIRQHYAGRLCVVERDMPTEEELSEIAEETRDAEARANIGQVWSGGTDPQRGVVEAFVWVASPEALSYASQRWSGRVEVRGLLQPVD